MKMMPHEKYDTFLFFLKIWNALHDTKTNKWSENKRKMKKKKKKRKTQPITGRVAHNNARQQFSVIIKTKRKAQYFCVLRICFLALLLFCLSPCVIHSPLSAHFCRRAFPCSVCARSTYSIHTARAFAKEKKHCVVLLVALENRTLLFPFRRKTDEKDVFLHSVKIIMKFISKLVKPQRAEKRGKSNEITMNRKCWAAHFASDVLSPSPDLI